MEVSDSVNNANSAVSTFPSVKAARRINRGHLKEEQVMHILYRRYGSVTDFDQVIASFAKISRATGVPVATAVKAVARFHKNGNTFK